MDAVCRCDRARLSRGCHLRESAPCLAHQAIAPAEASLRLLLRGLCSLVHVSSLVLLVSQHFLFGHHARAHSGVEHTSAVCTVTVRDTCDQPSSSPRATSSRSPCITGSSCSSSLPGNPLPLCTRSGSRSVQSSFGNTSSPRRKHCLPLSRHQRLTPPCS